jgi:hypothetical protein
MVCVQREVWMVRIWSASVEVGESQNASWVY